MAVTWKELFESRRLNGTVGREILSQEFITAGTQEEVDAYLALPPIGGLSILVLDSGTYSWRIAQKTALKLRSSSCESIHIGLESEATAGRENSDGVRLTYDLSPGSAHVTEAIAQSHYPVGPPAAANIGLVIGQNEEGEVEGVDISESALSITAEKSIDVADFDMAYLNTVYGLRDTVNDALFSGFAAGTIRFHGATFRLTGEDFVIGTFQFIFSPNRIESVTFIGGAAENVPVGGHDYLWFRFGNKTTVSPGAGTITHNGIISAHVAQVYEEDDLTQLDVDISIP